MRADEIMTDDVVTIRATQPIADAIDILAELGVRHLPVLGDAGELVGMLSDRDMRSLGLTWTTDGETMKRLAQRLRAPVARVMSTDVAKVGPEAGVSELIDTMLEAGVGAIPVVNEHDDVLLGIVSYVDVLRAVRSEVLEPAEPR